MSKTTENLKAAFAGESQAKNMYTFFAKVARKEGYHYIARIFEETAINEERHAKDHFKLLNGIGDTVANLKKAIDGENYETTEMYPTFAKEAEEGCFSFSRTSSVNSVCLKTSTSLCWASVKSDFRANPSFDDVVLAPFFRVQPLHLLLHLLHPHRRSTAQIG